MDERKRKMIISADAGGKTKRVTADGVSDTKNDIMLCSVIEAESHGAAARAFENHPHLQIPQSSIEVMSVRPVGLWPFQRDDFDEGVPGTCPPCGRARSPRTPPISTGRRRTPEGLVEGFEATLTRNYNPNPARPRIFGGRGRRN